MDFTQSPSNAVSTALSASTVSSPSPGQLSGTPSMEIQSSRVGQPSRTEDSAGSHNLTNRSPDSPRNAATRLPLTTRPTVPSHPIDMLEPTSQPTSETSPNSSVHSAWSVQYNPKITQGLHITLDKTFTLPDKVHSAKFSCDGKYLAVGLQNGETHIHDMMTGSKRSIFLGIVYRLH